MTSLLILVPIIGVIALNLPFGSFMKRLAFWFALGLFLVQTALAICHYPLLQAHARAGADYIFKFGLAVDHLGFIMLLSIGIVSLASLLVTRDTITDTSERFKFINLLIITSIGMTGIVMVRDLFSMYVFLEITAMASFVLIAFRKDALALEGSFKYLILSAIATVMMLSSIALLLLVSGDMSFAAIRSAVTASQNSRVVVLAVGVFICGLMIKGGLVPFHGWLPDAYTGAPAAISVLLAGIVTKAAGIYTIVRVVASVFGFTPTVQAALLAVGALSIVVGALVALTESDLKRMLAYSSISQVGYIILGLAAGTPLGAAGAAFHIFNHSIFKSLLFVNAAAVEKRLGTCDMDRMGGLASKMPYTGTTSVIGILSAGGIPPLAGFWSKIMIIVALWQSGNIAYSVIAILAGILTLGYLLIIQRKIFFGRLAGGLEALTEARPEVVVASVVLAAITVGAGVFFPAFYSNFVEPVKEIFIR
jgi:multicomponent Na+:H+ antiporter subunit D